MRGRALALALVLHGASAWAQWPERLAAAREALDEGDAGAARAEFTVIAAQAEDPRDRASALYHLAALDDDAYRFAEALAGYRAFAALDPGSRYAGRALARIEELAAHAEGGFGPLAALERVRRTPSLADDPSVLQRLVRDAAAWPPGPVRAEARYLVAEAWAGRLQRPAEAVRVYRSLARDPSTPPTLRDLAAQKLVELGAALGDESGAAREVAAVRAVDPEVRALAAVHLRRQRLRRSAIGILGLTAALGLGALLRAVRAGRGAEVGRAWRRPLPLAHIALLSLGSAGLARLSDDHDVSPFLALGAGTLGIYLALTAAAIVGSAKPFARAARALLGVLAALAVSFLAMERLDTMMLEGIKL